MITPVSEPAAMASSTWIPFISGISISSVIEIRLQCRKPAKRHSAVVGGSHHLDAGQAGESIRNRAAENRGVIDHQNPHAHGRIPYPCTVTPCPRRAIRRDPEA